MGAAKKILNLADSDQRINNIAGFEGAKAICSLIVLGCAAAVVAKTAVGAMLRDVAVWSVVVSCLSLPIAVLVSGTVLGDRRQTRSPYMLAGLTLSTLMWLTAFSSMFAGAAQSGIDGYNDEAYGDNRHYKPPPTSPTRQQNAPRPTSACDNSAVASCGSGISRHGQLLMPRAGRFGPVLDVGSKVHVIYVTAIFGLFAFLICLFQWLNVLVAVRAGEWKSDRYGKGGGGEIKRAEEDGESDAMPLVEQKLLDAPPPPYPFPPLPLPPTPGHEPLAAATPYRYRRASIGGGANRE